MPRPKKTTEEINAMREKILDVTQAIVKEDGPQAISSRAIAKWPLPDASMVIFALKVCEFPSESVATTPLVAPSSSMSESARIFSNTSTPCSRALSIIMASNLSRVTCQVWAQG